MKNQYRFERLNNNGLSINAAEATIFFAMRKLSFESAHITSLSNVNDLEKILSEERYYVANNLVVHKGKTATFKGKVVLAERLDLLSFLRDSMAENDLRSLLIAPYFKVEPKQVIFISEDECHIYLADSP